LIEGALGGSLEEGHDLTLWAVLFFASRRKKGGLKNFKFLAEEKGFQWGYKGRDRGGEVSLNIFDTREQKENPKESL